jgi:peptide/nickel transport system ATP-binding protein
MKNADDEPVLAVDDLRVRFRSMEGDVLAVDGVSFGIRANETVALVGESGCGKSVASLALARLVSGAGHVISGSIRLGEHDVLAMPERDLRRLRGSMISYVFQDATSALNPVQTVGAQIAEAIRLHRKVPDVTAEVVRLMKLVGLPGAETRHRDYPHQFSGGMQQRVMIAMALACHPKVLIADEPTTALDVTIQAQIFSLLRRLRSELGMAVLLITHNLGLVAENADRVHVMYAGRLMETGTTADVLRRGRHPYTRGLLKAVPRLAGGAERMTGIRGSVPHPARLPTGCRFHPRCDFASEKCRTEEPAILTVAEGHGVRCHYWKQMQ